jgi:hypothetical protein
VLRGHKARGFLTDLRRPDYAKNMMGWDILDKITTGLPPLVAGLLPVTAGVVFIVGFSRHGINFIKYGFKQTALDSSLEKRFDALEAKIDLIETNHFGHLKDFLTELTGIL